MYDYSIIAFGDMINSENKTRVDAYAAALRESITEESVVLEIGTGIGFFALLAAKFGARHVYAVEPNASIQVGRELAAANGCEKRITFLEGLSTDIELPERADAIVSDIRGALPWLADHIPSIQDARQRHLRPGGVLIPGQDTVCAAIVDAPKHFARRAASWDKNEYGLNLDAVRKRTINTWGKGHVRPPQLLTQSQCWATLDYYTIEDFDAQGELHWTIENGGTAHGISSWFETKLTSQVGFSNAPDHPHNPMYSQSFFPWQQPVDLAAGDRVTVQLRAKRTSDNTYEWIWNTEVCTDEGQPKAQFNQSTFAGKVWSPEDLKRRLPTFVPKLNGAAEIDAAILQLMDGQRNQQAIGQEIARRFPERFPTAEDALGRIIAVTKRYA